VGLRRTAIHSSALRAFLATKFPTIPLGMVRGAHGVLKKNYFFAKNFYSL
jgi:hypothetical protein